MKTYFKGDNTTPLPFLIPSALPLTPTYALPTGKYAPPASTRFILVNATL
jgi:hypothetical protein